MLIVGSVEKSALMSMACWVVALAAAFIVDAAVSIVRR